METDPESARTDALRAQSFGIPLAQRQPSTYWSYSPRVKIVRLLDHYGWKRVEDPRQARLVWGRAPENIPWSILRPGQLVDWVRGTGAITDKGKLNKLLCDTCPDAEIQPETFVLDEPGAFEAFLARTVELPEAVWIKKPTNLSSGIGVEVVADVEAFRRRWEAGDTGEAEHGPCLVQRYIEDPLLLEGTKSEIRAYCLIASSDPLLVLYHDGTVRLSGRPFELGNWDDPLRHITNTHRQKHADPELYKKISDQLKWTLARLGGDLYARGVTDDPGWIDSGLRPALKKILHDVLRAVQPRLERRPWNFQLLGMDCIVTADLQKVWLTEIQRGPGLAVNDRVKLRLIPALLEEAMEIVLEVDDRRRAGADLGNLESLRNFSWVINDAAAGGRLAKGPPS